MTLHASVLQLTAACLVSLGVSGVASCAGEPVHVTEVLNHGQCSKLRTGLTRVAETDLPEIRGVRLLHEPTSPTNAAPQLQAAIPSSEPLLVASSNGSQPTPGYAFALREARAEDKEVQLKYTWIVPAQDAMLAQVVTSPCSVVHIDNAVQVTAVSAWLDDTLLGRIELQTVR